MSYDTPLVSQKKKNENAQPAYLYYWKHRDCSRLAEILSKNSISLYPCAIYICIDARCVPICIVHTATRKKTPDESIVINKMCKSTQKNAQLVADNKWSISYPYKTNQLFRLFVRPETRKCSNCGCGLNKISKYRKYEKKKKKSFCE